jgi:hypothetical protein
MTEYLLRGFLVCVSADYPAAAKLSPYAGSTSATQYCRGCDSELGHQEVSSFMSDPTVWALRTLDRTNDVLQQVSTPCIAHTAHAPNPSTTSPGIIPQHTQHTPHTQQVKALPTKAKKLKMLKENGLYLKDPTHTYYALHHKCFPFFDVSIMLPQVPPCCRGRSPAPCCCRPSYKCNRH